MWPAASAHRHSAGGQRYRRGIVVQIRPEPALHLFHGHSFAEMIVQHLVAVYFPQPKVPSLRVGEVEPADRRAGVHRVRLGQADAAGLLDVEQVPEELLLGMVGGGRVARRGAESASESRRERPAFRHRLLRGERSAGPSAVA